VRSKKSRSGGSYRPLFLLVVVDEDKKVFNIVGPITDDTEWNVKIVELQKSGRNVRCFSSTPERSVAELSKLYSGQTGFTYSETLITNLPPRSDSYQGSLPDYAARADRNRVVQLLCRSCGVTRWAEMTVDYPGAEALRSSQVMAFSARCLKCGDIARDPYNWYR
jgi:hypothetical protein